MNNTKGQIAMSFNWIFVIIVGSIFLLFFFSIITSQTKNSEQKVSATVAKQFQTIFETTSQKPGTFKTYRTAPIELEFVCDPIKDISFYNVGSTLGAMTTHDAIFSPPTLKGTQLYTWTTDWSLPYKIMNFLYLTNPSHSFVFYNQSIANGKLTTFLDFFPNNLSIYYMNKTSYPGSYLNQQRYTYVLFENQLESFNNDNVKLYEKIIKTHSQVLVISPDVQSDIFQSGTVYFFSPSSPNSGYSSLNINSKTGVVNSSYYGKASLFGAVFAGEKNSYDCSMEKAFRQVLRLSLFQQHRIALELEIIAKGGNCELLFQGHSSSPQGSLNATMAEYVALLEKGYLNIDKTELTTLVNKLNNLNDKISFEQNCPELY